MKICKWNRGGLVLVVLLAGLVIGGCGRQQARNEKADDFSRLMTAGGGYLSRGEATNAIAAYTQALANVPESLDAWLNLANAHLLAGNNNEVLAAVAKALALDPGDPAAHYLQGLAYMRLNRAEDAVKALQQSQSIDPTITALNFQLGLAYERAGQFDAAIQEFETIVQFEPEHPSAHFQLGRLYQRASRPEDAEHALATHQVILAKNPNPPSGANAYEKCKYTEPRVAFELAQPDPRGVPVRFENATATAFAGRAGDYRAPIGVIDYNHDGRNSLFVAEGGGFRLLDNTNGNFTPLGPVAPANPAGGFRAIAVGDLNADRFEDIIVLGEQASHAFRFATNGQFREVTEAAGLKDLKAREGLLADLDFTGRLNLLTLRPGGEGLQVHRNLGNFYFLDNSTNSGLPSVFPGSTHLAVEDLNSEDVPGVLVARAGQAPVFFSKQRAGAFVQTNTAAQWPAGSLVGIGDLNNDLLLDVVTVGAQEISISFGGQAQRSSLELKGLQPRSLTLLDYDNDGWLDLFVCGSALRAWRNAGKQGFTEVTTALGLDKTGAVEALAPADYDEDGDTDLVLATPKGLEFFNNNGGNANQQLKLRLIGNRSNPSGLGARVELVAGNWRTIRTLNRLPFEIGVGNRPRIDVMKTRWFDLGTTLMDLQVAAKPIQFEELVLPTGSCPYLYAWDGKQFRFITDILGAAPLGLPVAEGRFVEADPDEFLSLGTEREFVPRDGRYEVRITEELREVLYLDTARLHVVDHPPDLIVRTTSKMVPGRPFPPHELLTLRRLAGVKTAVRSDGANLTAALAEVDQQMAGPARLREPQLRGLAEPFSLTLDFGGELPTAKLLVLELNGWLRFGGGMANIAGSIDPTLPFPFPKLEMELPDGAWKPVDVVFGVPAGKTKTILVDLQDKLSPGARRLRISTAYELYWDAIWLCEKAEAAANRNHVLDASRADLGWHGYSQHADLPSFLPLTPIYDQVQPAPQWRRTPEGWCTRYGSVNDLVAGRDNALVLLNGGDELALSFPADRLPPKPEGWVRHFFLYAVGWDKDADFHVNQGWRVEPLPFHGMDDQAYGAQTRPANLDDRWISKYNTRWVGSLILARQNSRR